MLRGSKENCLQLKFCTLKCSFFSIVDMLEFLFISVGTSARNWSGWMKAWGRRTWQYMWGEIMCLRTRTGSCIVRAQRTWRTGCKASLLFLSICMSPQFKPTQLDPLTFPYRYIVFEGEEGQDAGGLLREWYMIISREMFNPMYALFRTSPGDRVTYTINPSSHCNPNHLSYFKFVGRVVAKAVYDNRLLECYFTRSFYKHILGKSVRYLSY